MQRQDTVLPMRMQILRHMGFTSASNSSTRRGSSPMVRASGTVKVDPTSSVDIPQGEVIFKARISINLEAILHSRTLRESSRTGDADATRQKHATTIRPRRAVAETDFIFQALENSIIMTTCTSLYIRSGGMRIQCRSPGKIPLDDLTQFGIC